jgi:hypothetical protein
MKRRLNSFMLNSPPYRSPTPRFNRRSLSVTSPPQAAVPDFALVILMMLAFVKPRPSMTYTLNTTNDRKSFVL